jgi:OOP family OmpA-OmpF porin
MRARKAARPTRPLTRVLPRVALVEDPTETLERLRKALVGPERERLGELEGKVRMAAGTVAGVLPEAIGQSTEERGQALAISLEPAVSQAVSTVARREPELYAEALAPTIGLMVRKAVSEAFTAMIERLDEAMQRSMSLRGLSWRLEARRTGRTLAEVALLHTLVYRVEQLFLVHAETSLVLQHLIDPALPIQDVDEVAALLSALEDFGRQVLAPVPREAHLRKFELGDLTVWVTRERGLMLAAVVRGGVTIDFYERLEESLSRVRLLCQDELRQFDQVREVSGFDKARALLEPLLLSELARPPRRAFAALAALGGAALAALVLVGLLVYARHAAAARHQGELVRALAAEPGIVVLDARRVNREERLTGLRDPLARDPRDVLAERRLGPAALRFAPYVSVDPRIVQRRAEDVLAPPPAVRVHVEGDTVHVSGVASREWSNDARLLARTLPGIVRYDDDQLQVGERGRP